MISLSTNKIAHTGWMILFFFLPLWWGSLGSWGGYVLQPFQFGILIFICISSLVVASKGIEYRKGKFLIPCLYFICFLVCAVSFLLHGTMSEGGNFLRQMAPYVLLFFCSMLMPIQRTDLNLYGRITIFSALLYLCLSAYYSGIFFPIEFFKYLVRYNYNEMMVFFYVPVFNGFEETQWGTWSGSVRNALSSILVLAIMLIAISYQHFERNFKVFSVDGFLVVASLLLIATMFSRSAIAVLIFTTMVSLTAYQSNRLGYKLKIIVSLLLLGVLAVTLTVGDNSGNLVYDRVVNDTLSYRIRATHIDEAFDSILNNMLTGIGFHYTNDGLTLHNFFLSSWVYNGLFGLTAAVTMYMAVVTKFIQFFFRPGFRIYSILFLLFLVKTMVGGNGGFPNPSALIAIGLAINIDRNHGKYI